MMQNRGLKKIVVCGNIGVGKTTACAKLESVISNSESIYERFDENPFLPMFYNEMKKDAGIYNKFSFPTQMKFLDLRAQREEELSENNKENLENKCYIIDRSLLEDRYIFGQLHIDSNFMLDDEAEKYTRHFENLFDKIEKPDIIVFLRADIEVLLKRIKNRDRDMETSIPKEYLESLQEKYDKTFIPIIEKKYPEIRLLKYDTDNYNEDELVNILSTDLSPDRTITVKTC